MINIKYIILFITVLIISGCAWIKGDTIERWPPLSYVNGIPIISKATNIEMCVVALAEKSIAKILPLYADKPTINSTSDVYGYFFVNRKYQLIPKMYVYGRYISEWSQFAMTEKSVVGGNLLGLYADGYMFIKRYGKRTDFYNLLYIISHERAHSLGFKHGYIMEEFVNMAMFAALRLVENIEECQTSLVEIKANERARLGRR